MKPVLAFLFAAVVARLAATPAPADWVQPPVMVVSENVNVSVGEKMALVVGQYWLQYESKFDDPDIKLVSVYYPVFVPKGDSTYAAIQETTQAKLVLGGREFPAAEARQLTDEELGATQALPEDGAIAWIVFKIPRELARLRFEVMISHFQPVYHREGKTIAAYLPWLPNLEPLRTSHELKDADFVITFDALPGVTIEPVSANEKVVSKTPKQLVVHPVHGETIAVAVLPEAKK
ncbi:hypothetical protein DB347_05540 [Opitutaceae bacterium EW11]|nr:hypothetical protein DB347_05540 [Opitutaceae bacterium EW11]